MLTGALQGAPAMPKNVSPRVNEVREFLEIAKDFKDARRIIREDLSNSWDAGATKVSIRFGLVSKAGTRKKKIVAQIADDGEGNRSDPARFFTRLRNPSLSGAPSLRAARTL